MTSIPNVRKVTVEYCRAFGSEMQPRRLSLRFVHTEQCWEHFIPGPQLEPRTADSCHQFVKWQAAGSTQRWIISWILTEPCNIARFGYKLVGWESWPICYCLRRFIKGWSWSRSKGPPPVFPWIRDDSSFDVLFHQFPGSAKHLLKVFSVFCNPNSSSKHALICTLSFSGLSGGSLRISLGISLGISLCMVKIQTIN